MSDDCDIDQTKYSTTINPQIVASLASEVFNSEFLLMTKDDWPLFAGAKERTVADFQRAIDISLSQWETLGSPGSLAIMGLADEIDTYDGHLASLMSEFFSF